MNRRIWLFVFCVCTPLFILAQAFQIKGKVIETISRLPVPYANVWIAGLSVGAATDAEGAFVIDKVPPGIYKLQVSALGYKTVVTPEYKVNHLTPFVNVEMEEESAQLEGISVVAPMFKKLPESPVSLRVIGLQEIEKAPGANRDISRIVQNYPGVAFSPAGYRNDLMVRGGGPSENRFYLDGIEIPNINHFSTQGASGGPVGIINADLVREVNFYTGAFPASKGNALSSVLDFRLRDGDMDRNSFKATLGASEFSLTSTGHLSSKTSYLVSVRQSYLQLLFKVLGLPFLPAYTDAQFKIKTRFNSTNELTVLGIGGVDRMKLNMDVEGEDADYLLSYLPKIEQETFTLGAIYKHYAGNHIQSISISHSYLNNRNLKYQDNDESSESNLMLRLKSIEQESRLRLENSSALGNWKVKGGVELVYSQYDNTFFQKRFVQEEERYDYRADLNLWRGGLYASADYTSSDEKFSASLGVRTDICNFSSATNKLEEQLSPRMSLSYKLIDNLFVNGHLGLYYQLPPYTALGFKDAAQNWVNKSLSYMSVGQKAVGISWTPLSGMELSLEGFHKSYGHIPLSVTDGIPLMCKGNDYGVIGNEALVSSAEGRSYGLELMLRWLKVQKFNLSVAATLYKSEYRRDKEAEYLPSAWDNRFIINASGTYYFPKQWSAGVKLSCIGGAPYTPYDEEKSSLVEAWNVQGKPYYDYTRYNTGRLSAYAQLDVRVDKTFYLKKCMLGFYLDIQNITHSIFKQPDVLMSTGVIENLEAPVSEQRYIMKYIKQESGTLLPTLGITFEY